MNISQVRTANISRAVRDRFMREVAFEGVEIGVVVKIIGRGWVAFDAVTGNSVGQYSYADADMAADALRAQMGGPA